MNKITYLIVPLVMLCILLVIDRLMQKRGYRYDERQMAARGTAYKYGFFTFLLCSIVFIALSRLEIIWCEDAMRPAVAVFFSAAVFSVTAIVLDAFDTLRDSPGKTIVSFWLGAAVCLIFGLRYLAYGHVIEDGVLTGRSAGFLSALLFFIIGAAELLHWLKYRGAGKDGDAE